MEGPAGNSWEEHIDDEALEQYALDRLQDEPLAKVEEHLLLCGWCRDRLEELDAFVASLRSALDEPEIALQRARSASSAGGLTPLWALGAAAAAVIGVAYLIPNHAEPAPAVPVELRAMRGETPGASTTAHTPLDLRLDTTGLPPAANYRVEIVDFAGTQKWGATVPYHSGRITVRAPGIASGAYWVRLADPSTKEVLREYGLTVQ